MTTTLAIAADAATTDSLAVTFTVTRSGDVSGPSTVQYTATPGQAGTVSFGGGEKVKQIWITAAKPGVVSISLSKPAGTPGLPAPTVSKPFAKCTISASPAAAPPAAAPPVAPAPVAAPTTAAPYKAWSFRDGLPTFWTHDAPQGDWKTNDWFGGDGQAHDYMGQRSIWPDAASSRADPADLQTYSDPKYNGVQPFSRTAEGLVISARPNLSPDVKTPGAWTSGLITTEQSFSYRYGRVVFRGVRLTNVKGMWPAGWQLGQPYSEYEGDEIDWFEQVAGDPTTLHFNAHLKRLGWDAPEHTIQGDWTKPHDLGGRWTPDAITWTVDGQDVYSVPNPGFHTPHYLLFNLAVGPNDGGGWAAQNLPVAGPGDIALAGIEVYALTPGA
jgi:hypothetical protein